MSKPFDPLPYSNSWEARLRHAEWYLNQAGYATGDDESAEDDLSLASQIRRAQAQIAAHLAGQAAPSSALSPAVPANYDRMLVLPVELLVGWYTSAIDRARQQHDLSDQAQQWQHLGMVYAYNGDLKPALAAFRKSLRLHHTLNQPTAHADVLLQTGHVHRQQQGYEMAILCYRQAIDILDAAGAPAAVLAHYWSYAGSTHMQADNSDKALLSIHTAWEYAGHSNQPRLQRDIARLLGDIYRQRYNYQQARMYYREALAISKAHLSLSAEHLYICIGMTECDLGNTGAAIAIFEQVLAHSQSQQNPGLEALALAQLGEAYYRLDDYEAAIQHYQPSAALYRAAQNTAALENTLSYLGSAYSRTGAHRQALTCLQEAVLLAQRLGDIYREETNRVRLALAYQRQGESHKAQRQYIQATGITLRLQTIHHQAVYNYLLGTAYYGSGDYYSAKDYLEDAVRLFNEVGSPLMQRAAREKLVDICQRIPLANTESS